jgi:site-specific recombinase XerD
MNELVLIAARTTLPAIIAAAGERASLRFLEFFAANIRNPHTRRAYSRAVAEFMAWCEDNGVTSITAVQPLHVSAWIEQQTREHAAPTAKLRLAALRHLFDWLVTGQVIPANPAGSVRGPSHVVKAGKTPVLAPEDARALIDSIEITTPAGLRDRALIGLMVFSFARMGAALGMKVEDMFTQNRRLWVRLREKGGKPHAMPCHHNLETYITAYIEGAGLADDPKGPLFRTIGRGTGLLTRTPLPQRNAYAMVGRRAAAGGIATRLGNHGFRATGIPAYLRNGGTLEKAAQMANHASTRTTQLYDRRHEDSASMRWRGSGCEPDDDNRAASLRRPHMIKAGSKDEKASLLIAGEELTELKRITWLMSESLGLDTRIENYQANRVLQLGFGVSTRRYRSCIKR